MFCVKCNKVLYQCTCPDLEERLDNLSKVKSLFIHPQYVKQVRDHIEHLKQVKTDQQTIIE